MNPIDHRLTTGTVGELLVQLRLLQYNVQAAPPIKDSGNDLIAVRGAAFRAIQVKTSASGRFDCSGLADRMYHVVALVHIKGEANQLRLDESEIHLLACADVTKVRYDARNLQQFRLSPQRVDALFAPVAA